MCMFLTPWNVKLMALKYSQQKRHQWRVPLAKRLYRNLPQKSQTPALEAQVTIKTPESCSTLADPVACDGLYGTFIQSRAQMKRKPKSLQPKRLQWQLSLHPQRMIPVQTKRRRPRGPQLHLHRSRLLQPKKSPPAQVRWEVLFEL